LEEKDSLSKIIDEINQRFGTNFTDNDKVIVEQIAKLMSEDGEVIDFVNENNLDTFKLVNKDKIEDIILQRQEQNNLLFKKIFEDNEFKNDIIEGILNEIYKRVKGKKKDQN
jgi:type I restriction enzyme R subunit